MHILCQSWAKIAPVKLRPELFNNLTGTKRDAEKVKFLPFQITGEFHLEANAKPRLIDGRRCRSQLSFGRLFEQINKSPALTCGIKNLLKSAASINDVFTQDPSWS
ncbi:hypothetical protein D3C75_1165700 [compost metagenome]